ncbi:MAG TPA: lipoyl(octanoyl) transferase LipB [Gammaproteobacteria bacterium]|nr:lipoyl(octanoyl) transferase LipB [Gammaproteobacteria bacterium]
MTHPLLVRTLPTLPYLPCWQAMRSFTHERDETTTDEIWLLEHEPVFTQGQNGKPEHVLNPGNIPVIQTDRGGQITYHGPGQLMIYTLIDIDRLNCNVRELVTHLENAVIATLAHHGIASIAKKDAPGVYVNEQKIASIGLRVRRGRAYHGIAFNAAMDLSPFKRINPCGFKTLAMIDCQGLGIKDSTKALGNTLINALSQQLRYDTPTWTDALPSQLTTLLQSETNP